jgi:hypothetical protein
MAKFALPYYPKRWYEMVKNDDPTEYEFLEGTLKKNKETIHAVCWNLLQQFVGEGSPSIDDFEVDSVWFTDKHHTKGQIEVEFVVSTYFGCDDMDSVSERTDTIHFELDSQKKEIVCTIFEPEQRSTLDEF